MLDFEINKYRNLGLIDLVNAYENSILISNDIIHEKLKEIYTGIYETFEILDNKESLNKDECQLVRDNLFACLMIMQTFHKPKT
jgi:hypothetical protein